MNLAKMFQEWSKQQETFKKVLRDLFNKSQKKDLLPKFQNLMEDVLIRHMNIIELLQTNMQLHHIQSNKQVQAWFASQLMKKI